MHTINPSIFQLGVCRVSIKYENIELLFSFFVIPRNGPALLGILDCEKLEFLSVMYTTIDTSLKKNRSMNNLNKVSPVKTKIKNNLLTVKGKHTVDYIFVGP